MKSEICDKCGEVIFLQGENSGNRIYYDGKCKKCDRHYSSEYDAKTNSLIREKYYGGI